MRTFLELLPFRLERVFGRPSLRAAYVKRLRRRSDSAVHDRLKDRRRLFIDVAVICNDDAGTGIQRVVRAIAQGLLDEATPDWELCFVSARRKRPYFRIDWPGPQAGRTIGEAMRARPGDVFLGLDYSLDAVRRHRRQLVRFRRDGGALWFFVHDLLPLNRPEWFSLNTVIRYRAWLSVLAGVADGFLCNSSQTELELVTALDREFGLSSGYKACVLPLGHTILDPATADLEIPAQSRIDAARPFALMVGTLEPRKGHADVIAAFDELWLRGRQERLVLAGRLGWQVDALYNRVVTHPELGMKLFWLNDVNDYELDAMYQACVGVIVASHGEGFGLPLIEALGYGKPVLARNLPVFAIHQDKGVHLFPANTSISALADTIARWLEAVAAQEIVIIPPTGDWSDATKLLLAAIESPVSTPDRL